MAATFSRTFQGNSVQFVYSFDYTDIIAAKVTGRQWEAQITAAPAIGLWSSFFEDKCYWIESAVLQKTADFVSSGAQDLWVNSFQKAVSSFGGFGFTGGGLVPVAKLNDGVASKTFGIEQLIDPVGGRNWPGPAPIRTLECVAPNASAAGATVTTWALFGPESGNGSVSSVFVPRDAWILDFGAHLLSNTDLSGAGTITLNPYVCDASTDLPDPANFTAVTTPWGGGSTMQYFEAPEVVFIAGDRFMPDAANAGCLGFVPGGSYLAVRAYKDGAALSPHTVDIGARIVLAEAHGRGHAFASGGLPSIGRAPTSSPAFPGAVLYPGLKFVLNNGANLSTLTAGAAKLILTCRQRTF